MIAAAIAAQTASALIHGLAGKHRPGSTNSTTGAEQGFSAQLDALVPGAGAATRAVGDLKSLGQDLLATLGIGHGSTPDGAAARDASQAAAARAYATTSALR